LREEDEQIYQYLDIGEIRGEEFMEDLIEKLKAKIEEE
jgi:hypothetical protein